MKLRAFLLTLIASFSLSVAFADGQTSPPTLNPLPPSDIMPAGQIIPTIYYKPVLKADLSQCPAEQHKDILDLEGKVLARVCEEQYNICTMQGACVIQVDQKVMSLTFMKKIDDTHRFKETKDDKCPYGYGVRSICLDPFFTVAADLTIYNPGDVIFIPELIGLRLPNNEYHDGFLVIRDRGEAIKGEHRFDFFTGFLPYADQRNPFSVLRLDIISTRMNYYKVTGRTSEIVKRSRSYPRMPRRSWPVETPSLR